MAKIFETISQNKKTIILALGIGLFLSLIPLHSAEAWTGLFWNHIGQPVIRSLGSLVFGLLSLMIGVFVLTTGLSASLVASLAIWMIGISLDVPIIASEIVQTGWTFTRDLVNMFFILILVFIGLATILKINEYEAKKILPLLIIIALLINFSTVLVGFVVDISNIITNFFLNKLESDDIAELTGANLAISFFNDMLENLKLSFDLTAPPEGVLGFEPIMGHFAKGIVLVIFNLFSAMILFILFLLFFARIIALWILTILAPLAFAAYVLPNTRNLWKEWWQQLLQWAMIGIPISFFLYLAIYVQGTNIGIDTTKLTSGDPTGNTMIRVFSGLFTSIVSLVILIVGIGISLRFAPAAASAITSAGQRAGTAMRKEVLSKSWGATKAVTKGVITAPRRVADIPAIRAGMEAYKIHRRPSRRTGQPIKTRREALGLAIERGWAATRLETGWRTKAGVNAGMKAGMKGMCSAVKDTAKAGWGAAMKSKKKKKGEQCPQCKKNIPNDSDYCNNCGFKF